MEDSDTERLRAIQVERATEEAAQAADEDDPQGSHAHARRADKAAYLAEKLAEQEESTP